MNLSDSQTAGVPPANRLGATEYVRQNLEHAISAGVVKVGQRLPSEAALAARFGVSRSVVREALRVLEVRGTTATRVGVGTFVIATEPISQVDFAGFGATDLVEARPHIEIPAAGLAAVRRSEHDLEHMQGLIESMQRTDDPDEWVRQDTELHLAIAEASGNRVFTTVLRSIKAALALQSGQLNDGSNRRLPSEHEHRSIVAAIAQGSITEAEDAMRFHLDQVKDVVLTERSNTHEGENR
ncbi:FadR/GntR family transcriptional regulator [Pseudoclavibacter sp. CFCC 13611]|uniref:FadR/GntR family transcriptional regulator n=1 Tax=Pseudoclavibacter sp. CFCC 13611 TaxID=2615178 RepID=UPI0013015D38|nr:FadR/GntR family transcriptional regulator [Pseudoclavibacter sp. CFCC 13611]KAB1662919.1 FadR family transcriptional regulator [Pseudoclavibacter sp. CFCC 13611]